MAAARRPPSSEPAKVQLFMTASRDTAQLGTRSHHGGSMKDSIIRISITLLDVDPAI
jgi:hypothetical protein